MTITSSADLPDSIKWKYTLNFLSMTSTDAELTLPGLLATNYVEEERDQCDYCGNLSELRDSYGNCPSCGAPRKPVRRGG